MFARKFVALTSGAFLIAGASIGALSASADQTDTALCAVTSGSVHTNQPVTLSQGSNGGTFSSTTITCQGKPGAAINGATDGVSATFSAAAGGNCAAESGTGFFTGGSTPNGDAGYGQIHNGAVGSDNTFVWQREGTQVLVQGTIYTDGTSSHAAGAHAFTAELTFAPNPPTQNCAAGGIQDALLDGVANVNE